ncbi:Phage terminase, large subunit [Methylophaga frappieri]|uniref:Phage terminase, large subunit n=1 Tax=Methylophaga frappieri (strain ATCC BAA-2434 / DSM 25690 / JAM7) TaxID=754477 RepID=I1YGF6_METFJ|nr:terminase family protein [Methylophaga frappieri]AFJ01999.1 Phage terminase, large subunit [Methylophaga frappieri]
MAESIGKGLTSVNQPRKINLAEEMELYGVDVPQDIGDAQPDKEPVFLPYQQRWFEDESQIMIAEKSRRTGLTWAEAGRNVMNAAKPRRRGGCNTFYVGSKQEMALEYIAACALFARAFNELAEADVYEQTFWDDKRKEEILTYMIRFPKTGRKIQALSSRPSNLRGLQGDVVIDEAAFHESLQELLKAALALTMWGNKVRLISTHNGVDNDFNQYIQDAREGRKDYSLHRITLDDAIAQGLYKRICFVTGQEWSQESEKAWREGLYKNAPNAESADEEYGCIPKKSGGNYLTRVLIEAAMVADHSIPILRFEAPKDFESWTTEMREAEIADWCQKNLLPELKKLNPSDRHVFGEDFARRGDLTVFVPLAIKPDLRKRETFRVELRNLPYEQQRQVMFYICDRLPRRGGLAFDATGNGGYLAEQAALKYGQGMVDQVHLSSSWYHEWMPKLKGEFESFNLEIARHQTTLDDLLSIKVENGIPVIDKGRTKDLQSGDGKAKRHGDFAVGLVMAIRASWMDGGEIDFIAVPKGHEHADLDDDENDDARDFGGGAW